MCTSNINKIKIQESIKLAKKKIYTRLDLDQFYFIAQSLSPYLSVPAGTIT